MYVFYFHVEITGESADSIPSKERKEKTQADQISGTVIVIIIQK